MICSRVWERFVEDRERCYGSSSWHQIWNLVHHCRVINMVAIAEGAFGSCLWHNKLGHMSTKGMKMLVAKGALEGLKSIDMGLCESCVMGKQKKVSFTKTPREPKKVRLVMVHTDVWGLSPVSSLGGSRFYVTFIDDSAGRYGFTS